MTSVSRANHECRRDGRRRTAFAGIALGPSGARRGAANRSAALVSVGAETKRPPRGTHGRGALRWRRRARMSVRRPGHVREDRHPPRSPASADDAARARRYARQNVAADGRKCEPPARRSDSLDRARADEDGGGRGVCSAILGHHAPLRLWSSDTTSDDRCGPTGGWKGSRRHVIRRSRGTPPPRWRRCRSCRRCAG